jgi:hypothetical protein
MPRPGEVVVLPVPDTPGHENRVTRNRVMKDRVTRNRVMKDRVTSHVV